VRKLIRRKDARRVLEIANKEISMPTPPEAGEEAEPCFESAEREEYVGSGTSEYMAGPRLQVVEPLQASGPVSDIEKQRELTRRTIYGLRTGVSALSAQQRTEWSLAVASSIVTGVTAAGAAIFSTPGAVVTSLIAGVAGTAGIAKMTLDLVRVNSQLRAQCLIRVQRLENRLDHCRNDEDFKAIRGEVDRILAWFEKKAAKVGHS